LNRIGHAVAAQLDIERQDAHAVALGVPNQHGWRPEAHRLVVQERTEKRGRMVRFSQTEKRFRCP